MEGAGMRAAARIPAGGKERKKSCAEVWRLKIKRYFCNPNRREGGMKKLNTEGERGNLIATTYKVEAL